MIPNVTKIYGAHTTIGLDSTILEEVKNAVDILREDDKVKFGTGIHQFNGFSVKF